MDLQSADGSEARFAAYVEGLVSVIGHADRAGPLWDYCLGLIMPCERKSVEPMAAVTAPDRTAAQHQSLLHFVGQSPWSNEKVLAKLGEMVLPQLSATDRSKRGSSTTPVCLKRVSTRSAWHASTAVRSGSRTTAKWRCRCHSQITTRACRWLGVSICRKNGRSTTNVGVRRASPNGTVSNLVCGAIV